MSIIIAKQHLENELKRLEGEAQGVRLALNALRFKGTVIVEDVPSPTIKRKKFKRTAASRQRMSEIAKKRWAAIKKDKAKTER